MEQNIQFRHPFTAVVAGPSTCGKTTLVRDILANYRYTTTIKKEQIIVLWCYGVWQPCYETYISDDVYITYFSGLPNEDEIEAYHPDVVVLDDLMYEISKNFSAAKLFTMYAHHSNLSVFFLTQNLTFNAKGVVEINRNTMYNIQFNQPQDDNTLNTLANRVMRNNKRHFKTSFADAIKQNHGYLLVDCHPQTPNELRLRTNIVSQDGTTADIYSATKTDFEKLEALFDAARALERNHQ